MDTQFACDAADDADVNCICDEPDYNKHPSALTRKYANRIGLIFEQMEALEHKLRDFKDDADSDDCICLARLLIRARYDLMKLSRGMNRLTSFFVSESGRREDADA